MTFMALVTFIGTSVYSYRNLPEGQKELENIDWKSSAIWAAGAALLTLFVGLVTA